MVLSIVWSFYIFQLDVLTTVTRQVQQPPHTSVDGSIIDARGPRCPNVSCVSVCDPVSSFVFDFVPLCPLMRFGVRIRPDALQRFQDSAGFHSRSLMPDQHCKVSPMTQTAGVRPEVLPTQTPPAFAVGGSGAVCLLTFPV